MISILVLGPDFACSENLTQAFALWDEVQLISLNDTDWRAYDPGLIVTDETVKQAREIVENSRLVWLGDATSFRTLRALSPVKDWQTWAKGLPLVAHFGASAYFKQSRYYDQLCRDLNIKLFLLPNLMPLATIPAIPLHHPMPVMESSRGEKTTIVHSPGRDGKAYQKGTAPIEEVVHGLMDEYDFDYICVMHKTLAECLAIKATAHIFIDQLPPDDKPSGLGKSGLEALALGCATVSTMYDVDLIADYFKPPPVLAIDSKDMLDVVLKMLLDSSLITRELGERGAYWVRKNTAFEPWLEYVEGFIE